MRIQATCVNCHQTIEVWDFARPSPLKAYGWREVRMFKGDTEPCASMCPECVWFYGLRWPRWLFPLVRWVRRVLNLRWKTVT